MLRWFFGLLVGTLLFGIASPLFVRSYLPNQTNRGISTLPSGHVYRWRSEGYADTNIGPSGMPGKTSVASDAPRRLINENTVAHRIALWGDSQAEGVAVADREKLFSQIQRASEDTCEVFPFASSGDALGDWISQFGSVESEWQIDHHLILICELSDLLDLSPPSPPTNGRLRGLTAEFPAFLVQSARNVLIGDSPTACRLRFRPGPWSPDGPQRARNDVPPSSASSGDNDSTTEFGESLDALRSATTVPVTILYAAKIPSINAGEIQWSDPDASLQQEVSQIARARNIQWFDCSDSLIDSGRRGIFPHGFHNGQIGIGHLNADGYRLLADEFVNSDSYCGKRLKSTTADGRGF